MARSFCCLSIVFVCSYASAVVADEGSTLTGEHFRVICDFENETTAAQALETAEAVWPVATKLFAIADEAPERPREIRLFRTVAAYEKVDAELTGGRFRDHLAFCHWDNKASYIVLQPAGCSDEALRELGLPTMTRRLIAHEAAHLFRYSTMPNHRSHPEWLADGVASWIEERVMITGGWSSGAERDPHTSTMIGQAVGLLENSALPPVDRILRDDIDDVHWRKRYAVRWLLFRYLQETIDEKSFHSLMGEVRQFGGGSNYARQLRASVERALHQDDTGAIDGKFADYLRTLNPQWEEIYLSLETVGKEWAQIAFPANNAVAWRTEPVGRDEYAIEGRFKILPGGRRQLNLLLGRNKDGFVSVAFTAGSGVTVFDYHARGRDNPWERLSSVKFDAVKLGGWTRFRVEVVDDELRIMLDGQLAVAQSLRGRSMRGPWGLGAQASAAGVWRDVRLGSPLLRMDD